MKKTNYIKFSLDLLMALLFVLFFNKRVLGGQPFHEIAGLVFAVMYFTHILLNWKWVVNVTRKIFDRKLKWNLRGSYALNLLLLICMTFVIISGILISKVVFPNIQVTNQMWFHVTHIAVSYLTLVLVGVHVGLHWQWVVNVWKKIWRIKSTFLLGRYAAKALTVLILVFGVYEMNSHGFVNQLSGVTSVFGMSSTQNMQGHDDGDFHGPDGEGFKGGMGPGSQTNDNSSAQSTTQNPPANANGAPDFKAGMKGHDGGGSSNALGVIATYTGMMSVFVILTYYLKKLFGRKKKKGNKLAAE
ncbi:MAG: DUF4405 domain-containing protein [Bacillota bacterium]|nr:DUF4405 domain-containing protein [Bacillota bacterium]